MFEELVVFFLSGALLVAFVSRWYKPLFKAWPPEQNRGVKTLLALLPLFFLVGIVVVLKLLASFDVVDDIIYIVFYITLGYAWMYLGLLLMSIFFGIIWTDDAVFLNNKATVAVLVGEFIALAAIYAGANIGDGPGWWCVLFAGGLGLIAWLLLGLIYHLFTGIFERVTVDRDFGSGCRFCIYLIISGFILGEACSGDWTSFSKTVEEFFIGWPILPFTAIMIIIENICKPRIKAPGSV